MNALQTMTQRELVAIIERIKPKLRVDSAGCWVWDGRKDSFGYGRLAVNITGKRRDLRLHRVMYTGAKGPIPDHLVSDHLCRNRACCNPDHIELVTPRENVLRGVGPAAQRAKKTHCVAGHEFTPDNTYRDHLNRRVCRACRAALDARRYAKRKAPQVLRDELK